MLDITVKCTECEEPLGFDIYRWEDGSMTIFTELCQSCMEQRAAEEEAEC